jgi:hypothetical protein
MGHSTKSAFAQWDTVRNLLKRILGHSTGSRSSSGQLRIRYKLSPMFIHKHWPCMHMHVTVYPHARCSVSMCMWLWIHVVVYPCGCVSMWLCIHVVVYPCGCVPMWLCTHVLVYPCDVYPCGCVSMWSCIHVVVYPCGHVSLCTWPWIPLHNLAVRSGPQRRIWLCAMGHSTKFGYALWTRAQNLLTSYGYSAESLTSMRNHGNFFKSLPHHFKE